jgi:hypothetical protein
VRGNTVDGLRKLEEEASFGKYAKAAQAEWPERAKHTHGGLRVKRPRLLGARPDGPESEKNDFRIKFEFLSIPWLWKFAQGDLGEILT